MNRFLRKKIIISISIFMISLILALIASYQITHHQVVKSSPVVSASPTATPTPTIFIPNQNWDDQRRFLSTVVSKLTSIPQPDTFEYTLLRAYGAIFINQEPGIKLPPKVILADEPETQAFQSSLIMSLVTGTQDCYLQKSAADAFNQARKLQNIPLKSGYGTGDCTRTFTTNLNFWHKYANNQTLAQVQQGKETRILGTVAPPGTSQHLWGLAIDLRISTPAQRQALNQNGWFQTVENDVPHWTYIGWSEDNLLKFGLKNKVVRGISYWVTPI
jgi:hypothetical protein